MRNLVWISVKESKNDGKPIQDLAFLFQMQAEAEIEGGGKRTLLVVVSKAEAVVKIVAKGGFEVDTELWRECIFGTKGGPNGELPGPYTIDSLRFLPSVLETDALFEQNSS